jgi:predicted dehydrogenase
MKRSGIAVIGAGMIGAAHASGYRAHAARFLRLGADFRLYKICDANLAAAQRLAGTYGFERAEGDWRAIVADPEVDVISVTLPNFEHAEVVSAALAAGKHVLCEKPLALTASRARELVEQANQTDLISGTVFNYRRWPMVCEIRRLISDGAIGEIVHAHAQFQAAYAADPSTPHSWRYVKDRAGGGALHDVGAHAVDMLRFLCGKVVEISGANMSTIVTSRPQMQPDENLQSQALDRTANVDTDDVTSCVLRFANGAQGSLTASRVCVGMGNALEFFISGTRGTIRYDNARPNEYQIARLDDPSRGFVTRMNHACAPNIAAYAPVPYDGVGVGFAENFGFLVAEFLEAVATRTPFVNGSLEDGLRVAEILDAIQLAAERSRAVAIEEIRTASAVIQR